MKINRLFISVMNVPCRQAKGVDYAVSTIGHSHLSASPARPFAIHRIFLTISCAFRKLEEQEENAETLYWYVGDFVLESVVWSCWLVDNARAWVSVTMEVNGGKLNDGLSS